MSVPLRVLILEDRPEDAELVLHELRRAGFEPDWQRMDTEESYLASLDSAPDLILADHAMPQFDAVHALRLMQTRGLEIPFIIVSGTIGEDAAVSAMHEGATDYLLKDRLARLGSAVKRALEQKRFRDEKRQAEAALRESEKRYHSLFDGVPVGLYRTTPDGQILDANPALVHMLGYPDRQTLLATNTADIYANFEERTRAHNLAERDGTARRVEVRLRRFDGTTLWVLDNARAIQDSQGRVLYYEGSLDDITQRKRAEEEIRRRASQQSALNAVITAATQADAGLKELLQIAVDHTLRALGLDMGAIWLEEGGYITHGLPAEIAADMGQVASAAGASVHSAIAVDDWQEASSDSPHVSLAPLMTRFGIRASLSVPLVLEKRPVGGLSIASAQPRHWSEEDMALLEAIGHELGAAAHRTRLLEETRRRLAELETVVAVAAALRAAPTHGDMLPVVLNQLRSLLKADGAALGMRSAADDEMVVALARGTWADWTGLHIALDEDPIGHIFSRASARPYLNNAVDGDPHLARSALMNGMRAVACVPLIAENQTIGVLAIGRETEIADNELRLLAAIGDISANALHRAHIVETLEQRVAERTAELERQRQRMQAILDTAGDGIVITATDWTIEYVNPAQEQMSGFSAAEVIGQTTHIWHSGQTPRAVYDDMPSILTRGETWRGEVTHRRKDGTLYDVALTITPLRDDDGQVTDFVGIHRDISRQKELDRLKSKFVSDVSHELRTPVTNLKLYVAMLEHGKPEKRAQYMNTLNEQSDRLVQLVEDILDLSRLELGADKVQFAPVNLNVLARQVVDAHQPMAEAAGLALTFTPDPELAPVWGEHNQLAQVITNLVTNAIRYTPAGQVQVSTRLREGQACLEVRDTGTGIYAEDIPHLFERFYRGQQRAGQPITPGTGLGLAIVKEIVDLHSGEITVSSQVGVGTTLTVCLPRHPSTED